MALFVFLEISQKGLFRKKIFFQMKYMSIIYIRKFNFKNNAVITNTHNNGKIQVKFFATHKLFIIYIF